VTASVRTAAAASIPAAVVAHALDVSGRLPFVHETADVRTAMGPAAIVLWLALTAILVGLAAARRRPAMLGAPAALASAAFPELIGRHDLGAVTEPGAILGAALQWLLLVTVVALALVAERVLRLSPFAARPPASYVVVAASWPGAPPALAVRWRLRGRAPPAGPSPDHFSVQEGHPCTHHLFVASPPWRSRCPSS
jgi:hypothetical protein